MEDLEDLKDLKKNLEDLGNLEKRLVENEKLYQEKYGDQLEAAHHAVIRDEECCYLSSSLAAYRTDL